MKRLAFLFAALAASAVLVEGAARALPAQAPGIFTNLRYVNDPQLGPQALPGQRAFNLAPCFAVPRIQINRFGMRDRERALRAPGSRIALLGDSLAEGLQVADEETVSRRLELLLGDGTEVLNFGVSGTGTAMQWLQYRARVRRFHPQIVVLLWWSENDLLDNDRALKERRDPYLAGVVPYVVPAVGATGGWVVAPGRYRVTAPWVGWLASSAAGRWLLHWRRAHGLPAAAAPVRAAAEPTAAEAARAWATTLGVLEALARDVQQDGARLLLAIAPSGMRQLEQTGQVDPAAAATAQTLRQWARSARVAVADLGPYFASVVRAQPGVSLVHPCDGHWTPLGHALAAARLDETLKEQGWMR